MVAKSVETFSKQLSITVAKKGIRRLSNSVFYLVIVPTLLSSAQRTHVRLGLQKHVVRLATSITLPSCSIQLALQLDKGSVPAE